MKIQKKLGGGSGGVGGGGGRGRVGGQSGCDRRIEVFGKIHTKKIRGGVGLGEFGLGRGGGGVGVKVDVNEELKLCEN